MELDLQKAGIMKRIAAALFDVILVAIVATGAWWLLNMAVGYDAHYEQLDQITQKYAQEYDINLEMTQEEYDAMTPAQQEQYSQRVEQADAAINADEEAVRLYNLVFNLSLLTVSLGILVAMILLEFVVPILFGNGQTLGKKIFSLCLMRIDGVKLTNVQLFARTVLGKFAVGLMIPLYTVIMLMMNSLSGFLLILVAGLVLAQIICLVATKTNSMLHDLIAGTVVVDYNSQQIFRSTEELIEYQKKIAAERAARQTY